MKHLPSMGSPSQDTPDVCSEKGSKKKAFKFNEPGDSENSEPLTLPPIIMAPDRGSLQEENDLPGTLQQVPCEWKGGQLVSFWVSLPSNTFEKHSTVGLEGAKLAGRGPGPFSSPAAACPEWPGIKWARPLPLCVCLSFLGHCVKGNNIENTHTVHPHLDPVLQTPPHPTPPHLTLPHLALPHPTLPCFALPHPLDCLNLIVSFGLWILIKRATT